MINTDEMALAVEGLLKEICQPNEPGVAVIATQAGETLYRGTYGMADLEMSIPIEADMVFRLASITKQFTSVAVLMLLEDGAIALNDPITKYLPDYPTHGHLITLEHLLTHTSGIMNMTDMDDWDHLKMRNCSVEELISLFKNQPMLFAPGTKMSYCNSGYVLLGAVIEKCVGKTYEAFIQERIFNPLNMQQSYYDSHQRIIPRRVSGYHRGPDGYLNAEYISMTQPYAAGSLSSTVEDLAKWDHALYSSQLVKRETLQKAFQPFTLNNGSLSYYGYGWGLAEEYDGHRLYEHSGGLEGFATHVIRMEDQEVFVAVLANDDSKSAEALALQILGLAIGKPYQDPPTVQIGLETLRLYTGKYVHDPELVRMITIKDGKLFSQLGENYPIELIPFSETNFRLKTPKFYSLHFITDPKGKAAQVEQYYRSRLVSTGKIDKHDE